MEYSFIRALLEDTRMELGVAFEHGLSRAERQEQPMRNCAGRMAANGMQAGSDLLGHLCDELAKARVDLHWQPDAASVLYARLWKYIGLCLRRLEFMEAQSNLEG